MANHKSAIKRAGQSEEQRVRNRSRKTRMKNVIRDLEEVLAGKSPENAAEQLKKAASIIAKTASKGVIHKNTASRKISRLTQESQRSLVPVLWISSPRSAFGGFFALQAKIEHQFLEQYLSGSPRALDCCVRLADSLKHSVEFRVRNMNCLLPRFLYHERMRSQSRGQ